MIPDLDIYRAAAVILKRYGEGAPTHATKRATAMLKAGDPDGSAMWKRILRAIEGLQRTAPKPGEAVH